MARVYNRPPKSCRPPQHIVPDRSVAILIDERPQHPKAHQSTMPRCVLAASLPCMLLGQSTHDGVAARQTAADPSWA
jgi:hypothetical protein